MIINRCRLATLEIMKNKVKTPDPSQKPISNFFQKSTKRSSSSAETPPAKVAKSETVSTTPLSPEQRKRMEENKLKAKDKLVEKATNSFDMGATWKSALDAEFSKEYFLKVL